MADVVPMKPFAPTLGDRSVFDLTQDVKWAYMCKHGRTPTYIIVGGNYLARLKSEIRSSAMLRGSHVRLINGMVLVQVQKDFIEAGE